MASELAICFGSVQVLLSLRGSTYNARQVQEFLDWVRSNRRVQLVDFVETRNSAYTLKSALAYETQAAENSSLLQQPAALDSTFVVNCIVISPASSDAACCLAESAAQVTTKLDPTQFDFGPEQSVDRITNAQIETSASVVERPVFVPAKAKEKASTNHSPGVLFWLPIILGLFLVGACFYQKK